MTVALTHHELCFGCGQANVFGLHLELERADDGALAGRFFVKQDHQGPDGRAHPGIIGAALEEAIAHLVEDDPNQPGEAPVLGRVEIDYRGRAPVGSYVRLRAWLEGNADDGTTAHAEALDGGGAGPLAEARAVLVEGGPGRE